MQISLDRWGVWSRINDSHRRYAFWIRTYVSLFEWRFSHFSLKWFHGIPLTSQYRVRLSPGRNIQHVIISWMRSSPLHIQYIPRNMHTVFALLCFVVVLHWLIFPYPSGLLHWHCGNLTIAPVPAKQPWWIGINTSCEFIMNDCITTTKQRTTKLCAYFLGYTVYVTLQTGVDAAVSDSWWINMFSLLCIQVATWYNDIFTAWGFPAWSCIYYSLPISEDLPHTTYCETAVIIVRFIASNFTGTTTIICNWCYVKLKMKIVPCLFVWLLGLVICSNTSTENLYCYRNIIRCSVACTLYSFHIWCICTVCLIYLMDMKIPCNDR